MDALASVLTDVDVALQLSISEPSIDERNTVVLAALRLAKLLERGVAE